MYRSIKCLTPIVANQIAAGEVIERPASIVKELVENSSDAGATEISVDVYYGGLNRVVVIDNGCGILQQELHLAVMPHATSKLENIDDLLLINTMGFRGEALASIASISKLKIISKPEMQEYGAQIEIKPDGTLVESIHPHNVGTTIDVQEIFYNAPVRKKFLKTPKYEYLMIEQLLERFALSAPWIKISFFDAGRLVWSIPAAKNNSEMQHRIAKVFGKKFTNNAHKIDITQQGINIEAWLGDLTQQKNHNDRLWVYLNNRMIKDKLLNHVVRKVFEPYLHPGKYPIGIIYLALDPARVDVNVHPTKFEVRFTEPRLVHDILYSALSSLPFLQKTDITHEAKLKCKTDYKNVQIVYAENYLQLNNNINLLLLDNVAIFFDKMKLKNIVIKYLLEQRLPWQARKLSIPLTWNWNDLLIVNSEHFFEKQQYLATLGINIKLDIQTRKCSVITIPKLLPQINIQDAVRLADLDAILDANWFNFFKDNYKIFISNLNCCKIIKFDELFLKNEVVA